jgi:polar amino acid transport system permease protein
VFVLGYTFDWSVVFSSATFTVLLAGLKYALVVSALSLLFGNVIGLITAVARMSRRPPFVQIAYIYTDFFRTTPALVQLIWVFYAMPVVLGISLTPLWSGVVALSLNAGAFLAETFRSGLQSISPGQRDAASVLGLSRAQTFFRIILPQAFRRVLPATANVFIGLIKDSSLLSVIAVPELTYEIQSQVQTTFRPLELYSVLAVAYFVLTYPLSLLTTWLERRYRVT